MMPQKWLINVMPAVRPCLLITIFYFFVIVIYKKFATSPQFSYYENARSYKSKPFSNEPKGILLWNGFFGSRNWYLPGDFISESYFAESNCPATNCYITTDREVRDITEYEAVLFHTAEAFPLVQSIPSKRSPHQLYVFATMESPAHTKHDLSDEIGFYNLTMTYRTDSDIFWPYGLLQDLNSGQHLGADTQPVWRKPTDSFELDNRTEAILAGKNKTVAWFVSHCGVLSRRDELAQALQKHIPIDIYGSCGSLKCPRGSKICNEKLDYEYKFYLSFENSLCKDYITEKLFRILDHNVIPVVYGGADYSKFLPPLSYINVEDFKTVKDLANYLKFLDENPKEYRKYFWWKKYYKKIEITPFCALCEILNNPSGREKVQFYKDIQEWWFGHICRMEPKIKF